MLEVILLLPIVLIVTLAALQFGLQVLLQQGVTAAAVAGAREAALGASDSDVGTKVHTVLSAHQLNPESDTVAVTVQRSNGEVSVTVQYAPAGSGGASPDFLGSLGLSLGSRTLRARSLATME